MNEKKQAPTREVPREVVQEAMRRFAEHQRKEQERVGRYGEIRPQISMEFQGYRFVVVGGRLHYSKNWKFFPDFLRDYVPSVFGKEWFDAEVAKPEPERHPVMQWRVGAIRYMNAQQPQPDGTYAVPPNVFLAAYMGFAYDLYTVQDNGRLDDLLLRRLKNRDQFQGARHELFAEATCLRAGFTIEHEDERDGARRHAEFTAKHKQSGQLISVEAKSKHRAGVIAMPGVPQPHEKLSLRFGELLNDALAKHPPHPLVIFIDTNLPTRAADRLYAPQSLNPFLPSRIMSALIERVRRKHGGSDPYTLLTFTNHPHHFAAPNELAPRKHLLSIQPLVQPGGVAHPEAIRKLHEAANLYGNIPNEFPEQALPGAAHSFQLGRGRKRPESHRLCVQAIIEQILQIRPMFRAFGERAMTTPIHFADSALENFLCVLSVNFEFLRGGWDQGAALAEPMIETAPFASTYRSVFV